jgi:hypothetical protein
LQPGNYNFLIYPGFIVKTSKFFNFSILNEFNMGLEARHYGIQYLNYIQN